MEDIGSECGRDGSAAGSPDVVNTCVADDAHCEGRMARSDATVIFSHHGILDPEQAVLDGPAITPQSKQLLGRRRLNRTTRNGVRKRCFGFAFDCCLAFELEKLTQAGPVTGVGSDRRGRQCATLDATTTLLKSGCRSPCFTRFAFAPGGKSLPE